MTPRLEQITADPRLIRIYVAAMRPCIKCGEAKPADAFGLRA